MIIWNEERIKMNLVNAVIGAFLGIIAAMVLLIVYNKFNQKRG
jgi:hypothetical protein